MKKKNIFLVLWIIIFIILEVSILLYFIKLYKYNNIVSNSSTWIINEIKDKKWKLILNDKNVNDLFIKDSLLWDIIKDINLNDFNNLKLLKNSNLKTDNKIVIKWEILEQIYQNLLIIKSIKDYDISYCNKLDYNDADLVSQNKYCRWDFYINQLLISKDKNICKKFDTWFNNVHLMNSQVPLNMMCYKLYTLLIDKNINEQKILDFFKYIYKWWNVDDNNLNIFKTYFLNENYCTNIDVLSTKIKCLNYFYKDSFFVDFKNKAYQDIIKSKYLYE
jgi:hypothetical protein